MAHLHQLVAPLRNGPSELQVHDAVARRLPGRRPSPELLRLRHAGYGPRAAQVPRRVEERTQLIIPGALVDPIEKRDLLRERAASHDAIREQPVFLHELVRPEPLRLLEPVRLAPLVEPRADFRKVHVQTPFLHAATPEPPRDPVQERERGWNPVSALA